MTPIHYSSKDGYHNKGYLLLVCVSLLSLAFDRRLEPIKASYIILFCFFFVELSLNPAMRPPVLVDDGNRTYVLRNDKNEMCLYTSFRMQFYLTRSLNGTNNGDQVSKGKGLGHYARMVSLLSLISNL